MIDPGANQSRAVADRFLVWDPLSGGYVDLRTSIVGNVPAGLTTIQQLASVIDDVPVFAVSVDSTTADLAAEGGNGAPSHNQIFTGRVQGISAGHVLLGNVGNTADIATPVAELTQNELNKHAPLQTRRLPGPSPGFQKATWDLEAHRMPGSPSRQRRRPPST